MSIFHFYVQLLKALKIVLLISSFANYAEAFAKESAGEKDVFTNKILSKNLEYQKIGQGKLVYKMLFMGFDVYEVALYQCSSDKNKKIMRFSFLRDVEKKYLKQGWDEGLKNEKSNVSEAEWSWLQSITPNTKAGDVFEIYTDTKEFSLSLNGKELGRKKSDILASIILNPWVGPSSVDENLKKSLLGG